MERPIVVGYDDSDGARDALALGEMLADATGAPLLVAHVQLGDPSTEADETALSMAARAERLLDEAADQATGITPERVLLADRDPSAALTCLAEERDAVAIVVGSSARGPVGRVLVGSVPERLLHGSSRAVAIAPRDYRSRRHERLSEIGVGYDDRTQSRAAFALAVDLARQLGARLHAITAVPPQPGMYVPSPLAVDEYEAYLRALHEEAAAELQESKEAVEPGHPEVVAETIDGFAAPILTERSRTLDLLVLGSRSLGPVRRVVLGSVSTHLVRRAACPVLILPRAAEADDADGAAAAHPATSTRSPS